MICGGFDKGDGFIICGRIGRAVGLKGECAVRWSSGLSPVEIGDEIFLGAPEEKSLKAYEVAALRRQGRFYVLRLKGVEDRNAAQGLTNLDVYVSKAGLPTLGDGEYYCYQLVGLRVVTEDGRELGRIEQIFTAGENDVYQVRSDDGDELMIPATDEVVISIDLDEKRVVIKPLEGMLD